ncbi:MAG: metallophosphoesterase [Bacteroidota bacterium]
MKASLTLLHAALLLLLLRGPAFAQEPSVPGSYSNIFYDEDQQLYLADGDQRYYADTSSPKYTLQNMLGNARGTETGVTLDFAGLEGYIVYGLIPYGQAPHPLPVFRFEKKLEAGKVSIDIANDFKDPYDFVNWKRNHYLTLGYRLTDPAGSILFDGEVSLTGTGPFAVAPSIYEGPFVGNVRADGADIWCRTTLPIAASVQVNGKTYRDKVASTFHHWEIAGLTANQLYEYTVTYGDLKQQYAFKTALPKGSRAPFVFGYASDSRHAKGSGERRVYGTNAYIMKKIAALAYREKAAFVQFTGDMINGYLRDNAEQQLQYTNWKKAVEPFWHYLPFYIGMGNHEALGFIFRGEDKYWKGFIDAFPYATQSAEAAFAEAFVNPRNGPKSEDGNQYDPDPQAIDFPSYAENVYAYTYGNVAMIVLNSDYWYAPTLGKNPATSGGLHGYIMDNQLQWLGETLARLESDQAIDHIFVTQHTPVFPNGGHAGDDMWYRGNNKKRPFIAGKPVDQAIIQRRDAYLDLLINRSSKVVAVLTGDEHNYNYLQLTPQVPIYPPDYPHEKVKVSRPIFQINNGAAGAPYYAQEVLPWSSFTQSFSVENALCLFYVDGGKISMVVLNPDTLNIIDRVVLR